MAGRLSRRIGDAREKEGCVMWDFIILLGVPAALIFLGLMLLREWRR